MTNLLSRIEAHPDKWGNCWNLLEEARDRIQELEGNHCIDCCCARSWEALGIKEYTGKSIPEEITQLKERIKELEAVKVLK